MRKETLKYLYWVLAGTVIVLFAVGLAAFHNLQQAQGYGRLVNHTTIVLLKTEETILLLKDAESGMRGYLLTRNYDYLDPYFTCIKKLGPATRQLDSLTRDNSRQREPIRRIQVLSNQRMEVMSRLISISINSLDRDTLYQTLSEGKTIMDSILLYTEGIQQEEHRLLVEREKIENELSALTPFWLGLVSSLAVLLFSATFFAVIQTLRKRWHYERELEEAVQNLKKSNEELENFVYVASHHFQEPLRKIQTFSDRLTTKYESSLAEDARFLVTRINSAAARMQQLIDDLLVYLHIGQPDPEEFQPINVSALLHTFIEKQADSINEAQAEVTIEGDTTLEIFGSTGQLHTLLEQLLTNSLKFVDQNSRPVVKIRTFVTMGANTPTVLKEDTWKKFCGIEFSDNGIGFDIAYRGKIFQLFQRLHHAHEYPGTGIGLAICRKVLANHHGYLHVESQISVGTTFYILLPLSA